ncbi:BREX protein BrxB domain-containing protein [Saccharicrinis aurantiacus]|uniref:BREX protein BrxB domain-containing protein n=1 Tax=Saccharicrinis aurantiacus TaxID=1849719 RepID=UPI000950031B|nr:BREX protein BrxB domain-containing protein [Saccharicrinis aurantiacus]
MAFTTDHKAKFDNLKVSLETTNREQLRRTANGGNSILFAYPPEEEDLYHAKMLELNSEENFSYIDIAKLLVEFINEDGWNNFESYYKDFADTPHLIFNSDDEESDLMDLIVEQIAIAEEQNKIPVLIRTGALYGTGIENNNIMEHKTVMALKHPLIIFYPAKIENDHLYFLNFKPSSRYRCTVIE